MKEKEKILAFRFVKPGDRQIAIIVAIQIFTVIIQFDLPVQLFIAGPLARFIFKLIF